MFRIDLLTFRSRPDNHLENRFPLQEEQARFREFRALIQNHDDDKSGDLDAQELTNCIKVYSEARNWSTSPVTPTDEEIALLLKAAGRRNQDKVDSSEIKYTLDLWHSYVTNRERIHKVFEKYDTDRNQKLEFDQLVNYLTDLNEGHKPEVASDVRRYPWLSRFPRRDFLLRAKPSDSDILPSRRTPRSGRCCSR